MFTSTVERGIKYQQDTAPHFEMADLVEVARRQKEYNLANNLPLTYPQAHEVPAFNPVDEFCRLQRDLKRSFNSEKVTRRNIETHVAELVNAAEGHHLFEIKDGQLVAEDSDEPVRESFLRGFAKRKMVGSLDLVREERELDAWVGTIEEVLTDTSSPPETKVISLSPPSSQPDSLYGFRFVDVHELTSENNIRRVRSRRLAVNFSLDDYKRLGQTLDSNFLSGYDGQMPFDAWCLGRPITTQKKLPELTTQGLSPFDVQTIVIACSEITDHLMFLLKQNDPDWRQIAITTKALQVEATNLQTDITSLKLKNMFTSRLKFGSSTYAQPIRERIDMLAAQVLKTQVLPCGLVTELGGREKSPFAQNSVSQFGESIMKCVECPFCHNTVDAKVTSNSIECPSCHTRVSK